MSFTKNNWLFLLAIPQEISSRIAATRQGITISLGSGLHLGRKQKKKKKKKKVFTENGFPKANSRRELQPNTLCYITYPRSLE